MSGTGGGGGIIIPHAVTFPDLWGELKSEASAEWAKLKAEAVSFEHTVIPIIEADVVAILSQFKTLAVQTVLSLAQAEFAALSGSEKQSTVVTTVFQAAEAQGLNVAIQDVRMFAQQAYDAVATTVPKL